MKIKKWIGALLAAVVIVAGVQMPGEVRAESDMAGSESSEDSELESPEGFTEKKVVVLDPGHGGREAGAYAVHNGHVYREEEINWKISCYIMEELKKYPYIEVHLTRTKKQTKSLVSRVLTAKSYHADLLVSQHINDGGSPYPKGASVLISKGTYRPYLSEKEKLLGKYVIEELGKLGITKRYPGTGGMEYRLSEDGSRYPNGALRDYYGIVAIFWKPEWIFHMADAFADGSPLHGITFATHSCILAQKDHILFSCEDIGRHNALDKVIGYALRHNIDLHQCMVYSSGRIPTDMTLKVIHAGIPILSSKASPTSEAIDLAKKYHLTLICAARRDRMKVFTK